MQPREAVSRMSAYSPPASGREGRLRLDFNENTVGCSRRVLAAIRRHLTRDRLATYPEYESGRGPLAAAFGRSTDETVITNGTDEAIQLVLNTFVNAGDRVILSEPTFAMYRFYASVAGTDLVNVRPGPDLVFPVEAVRQEMRLLGGRAVFIANPNNPTATAVDPDEIERLAAEFTDTLVFVDEAYFEFYGRTLLPLVTRYRNLLVSRTFSKAYGLAALRIGCLFAHPDTARHLLKAQSPYSVNSVALVAALEAVCDQEYVNKYVAAVLRSRQMLEKEFRRLGVSYVPSSANFVLARFGDRALAVRDGLRERGILARDRSYELPGCVRFTLGTPPQTRRLIRALREVLG
jgi:histidinol-phosphate aminotransferase